MLNAIVERVQKIAGRFRFSQRRNRRLRNLCKIDFVFFPENLLQLFFGPSEQAAKIADHRRVFRKVSNAPLVALSKHADHVALQPGDVVIEIRCNPPKERAVGIARFR